MDALLTPGFPRLAPLQRGGLMVLSGVISFLGFVGFGFFPLTWVSMVLALVAIRGLTPGAAFRWGWLYGLVAYYGGYFWLAHAFETYFELPGAVAFLLVLLVSAVLGILFALLFIGIRVAERTLCIAPVWSLPVVNVALEFVDPNFLPYNIGASQYRFIAITQIVELTGLLGLTALIGLVNGAVFELVEARLSRRRVALVRVAVPAAVCFAVLLYGLVRIRQVDAGLADAPRMRVAVVQPNLGTRGRESRRFEFIERHVEMTRAWVESHPETDLVVWPEAAIGDRLSKHTENVGGLVRPLRPMVVGAIFNGSGGRSYNSVIAVGDDGAILQRYDKVQLIPFSEIVPMVGDLPGVRRLFGRNAAVLRGATHGNLVVAGRTLLPSICYEDIFPRHLRAMWHRAGPAEALVNVTNDAWFGDTQEPRIHLALATFRSIEARRSLIRATNTGVSAIVDPVGRIVSKSGQWQSEVLEGDVPLVQGGSTTPYLRFGDWLGWMGAVSTFLGILAVLRVRNRPSPEGRAPTLTNHRKNRGSPDVAECA